jgi:non-heme chloroperoxidase
VKKAVLIGAVTPLMLKTPDNVSGTPIEVYDGIRKGAIDNRAQQYFDIASTVFFGFNRPGAKVSEGLVHSFVTQGLQAGHKNTFDSIKAFSETDFRPDLAKFDVPTLIVHGDDDQLVSVDNNARQSHKLIKGSQLILYKNGPHGITDTHKDRLNQDLLTFLRN